MKRKIIYLISALLIVVFTPLSVLAASRSNTKTGTEFFSIPNGGHEAMPYKVTYTEYYYVYNTNYYCYNKRGRFYGAQYDTFSAAPLEVILGNVKHYNRNGTEISLFNSWTAEPGFSSGEWIQSGYHTNSKQATYSKTSGNKGRLMFMNYCSDALVPTRTYSIDINL